MDFRPKSSIMHLAVYASPYSITLSSRFTCSLMLEAEDAVCCRTSSKVLFIMVSINTMNASELPATWHADIAL